MPTTSRIPGFYRLDVDARRRALVERAGVPPADLPPRDGGGLALEAADLMVENVVGTYALPLGIGLNLRVDGEDVLVPMVVEEPSVVAAVSNMARLVRAAGGFRTEADPSMMIGQVEVRDLADVEAARAALLARLPELEERARAVHPQLAERGGGVRGLEVRRVRYDEPGEEPEEMLVLHVLLDCVDAMGANMVNTVAERLAPEVERITGGRVGLRILSNLASRRLARAACDIPAELLGGNGMDGREVARGIAAAYRFAWADPHRAATHNKGVMNGIDAVALATGNDWRAIEAGVHAWAARDGRYRPVTSWKLGADDVLRGRIEVPLQVGTVGGTIRAHPGARANLALMGRPGARRLARIMAAVGLAQNLAALRALATEGIQAGHMRLHARHLAAEAGARGDEVERVADALCARREWTERAAREELARLRAGGG